MIRYTHKEELWNVWSHVGGVVMGVVVGVIFMIMAVGAGSAWASVSTCLACWAVMLLPPSIIPYPFVQNGESGCAAGTTLPSTGI